MEDRDEEIYTKLRLADYRLEDNIEKSFKHIDNIILCIVAVCCWAE